MRVVFRVDATPGIGLGHLLRCLALGQECRDQEDDVIFITCPLPPGIEPLLAAEGISRRGLPSTLSLDEDFQATVEHVREARPDWVVLDGYGFDGAYQERLLGEARALLVIDDTGHLPAYHATALLNQNPTASRDLYPAGAGFQDALFGLRHALLRREIRSVTPRRDPGLPRQDPGETRVLVTFGGSDPTNATVPVIHGLHSLPGRDRTWTVQVGPANPRGAEIRGLLDSLGDGRFELATDSAGLPERMARATLAISAGGSACWELLSLGTPLLVAAVARNQVPGVAYLIEAGLAVELTWGPDQDPAAVTRIAGRLLAAPGELEALRRRSAGMVDGHGASRVRRYLGGEPLWLRPVRTEDSRLLFDWANDPEARRLSFSPDPIPWESHEAWFARKRTQAGCHFFLGVDPQERPVGSIRVEEEADRAVVSVNIEPGHRGQGLGSFLIRKGTQRALHRSRVPRVDAYIFQENVASVKAFERAGYRRQATESVQGRQVLRLAYDRR